MIADSKHSKHRLLPSPNEIYLASQDFKGKEEENRQFD
jgi:hypothetical protein